MTNHGHIRNSKGILTRAHFREPAPGTGLDYYSKTAFEITWEPELRTLLLAAGAMTGFAEALGGPPTKGFGFAFGLDRMVLSLSEAEARFAREQRR
jgi:histidyl-tRNA synthetase